MCCFLYLLPPLATGTPSLPASMCGRLLPSHLFTYLSIHTHTNKNTQTHTHHTKKKGREQSQCISHQSAMNQIYGDYDLNVMRYIKVMNVLRSLYVHLIKKTANMSECFHEGMINRAILQLFAFNKCGNWMESVVYRF